MQIAGNQCADAPRSKPKAVVLCNGALLIILLPIAFFSFLAYLIWLPHILSGLGSIVIEPGASCWGFYIFPASLMLIWGHKRISRESAVTRFSKAFWPVAAVHYIALASAFVSFVFMGESAPDLRNPGQFRGLGNLILAVVICVTPALLSLPPLVFTIRETLRAPRGSKL